jgi:hypothetical protein
MPMKMRIMPAINIATVTINREEGQRIYLHIILRHELTGDAYLRECPAMK